MPNTQEPVEPEFKHKMIALSKVINEICNGEKKGDDREIGFCLLMFKFGEGCDSGRMNYISNSNREDMIKAMEEFIGRVKGNT